MNSLITINTICICNRQIVLIKWFPTCGTPYKQIHFIKIILRSLLQQIMEGEKRNLHGMDIIASQKVQAKFGWRLSVRIPSQLEKDILQKKITKTRSHQQLRCCWERNSI